LSNWVICEFTEKKPRIARACPELAEGLPGFSLVNLCDLRILCGFFSRVIRVKNLAPAPETCRLFAGLL